MVAADVLSPQPPPFVCWLWPALLRRCLDGKLRVVDYKTGKLPNLVYSPATNAMIMDNTFFQLKVCWLVVGLPGWLPGLLVGFRVGRLVWQ